MAQFKVKKNFIIAATDKQFYEGQTYELSVSEAEEINRKIKDQFNDEWLERVEEDKKSKSDKPTA